MNDIKEKSNSMSGYYIMALAAGVILALSLIGFGKLLVVLWHWFLKYWIYIIVIFVAFFVLRRIFGRKHVEVHHENPYR